MHPASMIFYNGGFQWTGLPHGLLSSVERNMFATLGWLRRKNYLYPFTAHRHASALHERKSTLACKAKKVQLRFLYKCLLTARSANNFHALSEM